MKLKILAAAFFLAWALSAQTAQTDLFRAVMQPPSAGGDSGAADIVVHVVLDSGNNVLSGSVDFDLNYQFPSDQVVTGLAIVKGSATMISSGISGAFPLQATAGSGRIYTQAQVAAGNQAGLAALKGLIASPAQYSVTLLTSGGSTGAMSGALQAASSTVLMAVLSSNTGTGAATVRVNYTGASYAITSAEVLMQLTYQFPAQVTFASMRIYSGQGQSGQLAVAADVAPGTLSASSGAGVLTVPGTEIDMSNSQMVQAVQGILGGPGNFSVDVGTAETPTVPLTGQLRGTDSMTFQIPGFAGSGAASEVRVYTLRLASGSVLAGTVIFDVNYRLAAGAQITGLDIDDNILAPAVTTDPSGSGNVFTAAGVYAGAGLTSVNGIVSDPEAHKIDLATTGSATPLSAPLATAITAAPVAAAVIPIVEVKTLSTFAPGELVEIYGTNLAKVTTDLSGWPGGSLPTELNGVSVTLGGQTARLLYVSPYQVDAALAFETPTGTQMLTLNNSNGASAALPMTMAAVAPALYTFAFENSNFSLVSASNPAHAGDVLVFYTTGMGQTSPSLATGQTTPEGPPFFNTEPVTVSMGGVSQSAIYSIASPPYVAGLYQLAFTVPSGLGSGSVPVVATSGGLQSNTVMVPVQ
jgi:uncharacterized protein (TIGR03437 family)